MPKKKIDTSKHIPFMTTEHFTLQSARGIINAEIVARVNLYFLTLSSLVVALAFLAQLGQMNQVLVFFALVAFPALLILGFTSFARIGQLGFTDFAYIRAINRVRRFYLDSAPELEEYMLFPAHDDNTSTSIYGGYGLSTAQNFLAMGFLVVVVNSLVAASLIAALLYSLTQFGLGTLILITVMAFVAIIVIQFLLGRRIINKTLHPMYDEVRFPKEKKRTKSRR